MQTRNFPDTRTEHKTFPTTKRPVHFFQIYCSLIGFLSFGALQLP